MALTSAEIALLDHHKASQDRNRAADDLADTYYNTEKFAEDAGLVTLPTYRDIMTVIGWSSTAVDTWVSRSVLKSMILPGEELDDPQLRDIREANNLDSELDLFRVDRYVYGRAFLSVGVNESDRRTPLIHVESPRHMTMSIDARRRTATSAAKIYGQDDLGNGPTHATLYLPDYTLWARRVNGVWLEERRDNHRLGRVPVVMSLYGRRSGSWDWRSAINPTLRGAADAATRAVTNMGFASEAHGIPQRWAVGVAKGDFVNPDGSPRPAWQARMDAIWATANKDARMGNFEMSDLANFKTQMSVLIAQAASASHLSPRFFGETTVQPMTAEALQNDEVPLVTFVQTQNRQIEAPLGWAAGLALRIANGEWVDGSRIRVEHHSPATPTIAQREDALVKRRQVGMLSRQGYWEELGWSQARIEREEARLEAEANDPLAQLTAQLMGDVSGVGAG